LKNDEAGLTTTLRSKAGVELFIRACLIPELCVPVAEAHDEPVSSVGEKKVLIPENHNGRIAK
jgi:hypothetical protein